MGVLYELYFDTDDISVEIFKPAKEPNEQIRMPVMRYRVHNSGFNPHLAIQSKLQFPGF